MNRSVRFLPLALLLVALNPDRAVCADPPGRPAVPVENVIVAFKTHFDIGYTDFASNVVRRYQTTMIDQALRVCDENRALPPEQQFVWTIPGWPMKKITEDWNGQTAARKTSVLQAYKEGRFVTHALPFSMHTELLELEDIVRGLGAASKLSRSAGLPLPRDAKMTDVPSHSWALPTLLKQAGVEFLHLGCNAASRSPEVPPLFWWEGPDGSRLLTMYTAEGYGTGLVPPRNWPYRTWLALIHTGDNHGPPTPAEVKEVLDQARKQLPGVKVRIGRQSDFADLLLAEKPELPVVRGDMPDTWIHGPMSDPQGARLARNTRPAIAMTEALGTLLRAWDVRGNDVSAPIASAYEQSLLYGEHTWGGALYWVTSYSADRKFNYGETWKRELSEGRFQRLEASWDEHTSYIKAAQRMIAPLLEDRMHALAQAVSLQGRRITVYNPLPWKRDGLVLFDAQGLPASAIKPVDGDGFIPMDTRDGKARFVALGVPAMGYRTYVMVKAHLEPDPAGSLGSDPAQSTIESRFFKLGFDPRLGRVTSLVEKRRGRELLDRSSEWAFGGFLYERFDSNNVRDFVDAYVKINADWAVTELGKPNLPPSSQIPYRAIQPALMQSAIAGDGSSLSLVLTARKQAPLPEKVVTRATVYRDLPYVDFEVELSGKEADPWPEAGWLCLPFKIAQPRFHLGRLGSIIDPATDLVPGSNHRLMGLNTGLAISDAQGQGVGLCALDSPLVSLETPGCWKYSRDFVPTKPVAFINLFNNQWTTNFRLWNRGSWSSRVRLWSFDRYDAEASLSTPSLEARYPLQAAVGDGPAGGLPPSQSGLEISRRGVLLSAFGPNPDGPGLLLRLWEQAGQSGPCEVRLPGGLNVKTAQPVDLRGQVLGEPLPVHGHILNLTLRSFAPLSLLLVGGR